MGVVYLVDDYNMFSCLFFWGLNVQEVSVSGEVSGVECVSIVFYVFVDIVFDYFVEYIYQCYVYFICIFVKLQFQLEGFVGGVRENCCFVVCQSNVFCVYVEVFQVQVYYCVEVVSLVISVKLICESYSV